MRNEGFWVWFDEGPRKKLGARAETFAKMFEHLDQFDGSVTIIETGCARHDPAIDDSWRGDGCSTILFDMYVQCRQAGMVYSVDLSPEAVKAATEHVSWRTQVTQQDSVEFLAYLAEVPARSLHLLYLDSFDLDVVNPLPAAVHHYNELMAAMPMVTPQTLIVVDDSPATLDGENHAEINGKGFLVARHMGLIGAEMQFCDYQVGWTMVQAKRPSGEDDLRSLVERARSLVESDKVVAAEQIYRLILGMTTPPESGQARVAHGEACDFYAKISIKRQKYGAAADWWRAALQADPLATDYRLDLVTRALMPAGNMQTARTEAERATKIAPDYWKAWHVFGGILHVLNESKEATEAYDKEMAIAPEEPDTVIDRISIAIEVADYDKARELIPLILDGPRHGDALHCLAMIAHREHRHQEAIDLFDCAIEAGCHDISMAHWNKSLSLHALGRYREGWEEHSWRAKVTSNPALSLPPRRFVAPMWQGEPPLKEIIEKRMMIKGKPESLEDWIRLEPVTIHVHAEAGNGDQICMVRYLKLLDEQGYKVHYEAGSGMRELIAGSFPEIEVFARAPDYPGSLGLKMFDYHIPIGELPHVFKTDIDSVPWPGPYIKTDTFLAKQYREQMRFHGQRKIGICWSAGIREGIFLKQYGMSKSVRFDDLYPLFNADAAFYSLQVGPEREDLDLTVVHDLLPEKPSWADTAALVENLDLVITVDTAVAHLAGAMGKPVWVINRKDGMSWHFMCWQPDFKWNDRSPWYPTARVFRQREFDQPHYWKDVIGDIAKELQNWRPEE